MNLKLSKFTRNYLFVIFLFLFAAFFMIFGVLNLMTVYYAQTEKPVVIFKELSEREYRLISGDDKTKATIAGIGFSVLSVIVLVVLLKLLMN